MKTIFNIRSLVLAITLLIGGSTIGQSLLPAGPLIVRGNCEDDNANTIGNDTLLVAMPDTSIRNNFTILTYRWQGPSSTLMQSNTESSYKATKSDTYTLSITARSLTDSTRIETFTDKVEVFFIASCCEARMPNAFTPNGDNTNDIFAPVKPENCNFMAYELQIFNRWGKKVFDTNNGTMGWDGKIDGKDAPSDVYVYVLKYVSENTELAAPDNTYKPPVIKGDVTLIR